MLRRLVSTACLTLGLFAGQEVFSFTLSGKVTNSSGVGVNNVTVNLFDSNTGNQINILTNKTDALGNYNLNQPFGLPAGTYDVAFKPPGGSGLAPVINRAYVLSGNQILNDTVPAGFTISGVVSDTAGAGLVDIDLKVTNESTGVSVYTPGATDGNGFYSNVIPPGLYTLQYRPIAGQKLAATQFTGVIFHTDTTINATLRTGFFVSGTVLNNTSQPVQNANIKFKDSATKVKIPLVNHSTNNNGQYQVVVAAGTYDITVEPVLADKLVAGQKLSVPVTKDTTVNFTLQPGRYLSGFVRRASNMAGVVSVSLEVRDTLTNAKLPTPFDTTDATGFYKIVVPTGTFKVDFLPPPSTSLASVESTRVLVTTDRTLNANLPAGFTLSGTVQRTGGGGLFNVDVKFFNSSTGVRAVLADHFTDTQGNYAVVAVAGTYTVEYDPPQKIRRLAQEFLNFSLSSNMTLNVTLDSGRSISGFIKDSMNNPIFDVDLDAFTIPAGSKVFTPSDNTDSTGFYQVIVPVANLDLAYNPLLISRFAGVSFAGVPITRDTTISLTLRHGVQLSGTVRDSLGTPISGVKVRAFGSPETPLVNNTTDSAGSFSGILVPGTYSLRFTPSTGSIYDSLVLSGVQMRIDSAITVTLHRKPSSGVKGDLSSDGILTGADVVLLLNCVFLDLGACPLSIADVNCDGILTGADVILELNAVFLGSGFPCP